MFTHLNTPSLTLDACPEHVLPSEKGYDNEDKPLAWQIRSEILPRQHTSTGIQSKNTAKPEHSLKLLAGTKLADAIKSGTAAIRLDVRVCLSSSSSDCGKSVRKHRCKESLGVVASCPWKVPAEKNSDAPRSSSSSSIASKNTLIGSTSTESSTELRPSLSLSAETPSGILSVPRLSGFTTNPSSSIKSSNSSTSKHRGNQFETSSYNHVPLTKSQQCCKMVKEALCSAWTVDRTTRNVKGEGTMFVLRRHPLYPEVLEVIDCEDTAVAYRKISRSGKSWRETFHDAAQPTQKGHPASSVVLGCSSSSSSRTTYANNWLPHIGMQGLESCASASRYRTDPLAGSACWPTGVGTSQAQPPVLPVYTLGRQLGQHRQPQPPSSRSSSLVSASVGSVASGSERSQWQHLQQQQQWQVGHPRAFDAHELWEISSPCPSSFPLHCRDARGVIRPIPLTPMVLDRHQFCYRFHLAGNKMRWTAKRQEAQCMAGLQCYVRNTVVAQLLFGGYSTETPSLNFGSNRGSWCENYMERSQYECSLEQTAAPSAGSHLPRIVILPAAYAKLESVDSTIVESFILFTGIEVFECFHDNGKPTLLK
ncbi:hypothetical protein IW138_003285 [Coemansia sp. RSA 986]|nr:hypothetical protein IW138_003285 [Coemansia sp. RSA 986]